MLTWFDKADIWFSLSSSQQRQQRGNRGNIYQCALTSELPNHRDHTTREPLPSPHHRRVTLLRMALFGINHCCYCGIQQDRLVFGETEFTRPDKSCLTEAGRCLQSLRSQLFSKRCLSRTNNTCLGILGEPLLSKASQAHLAHRISTFFWLEILTNSRGKAGLAAHSDK